MHKAKKKSKSASKKQSKSKASTKKDKENKKNKEKKKDKHKKKKTRGSAEDDTLHLCAEEREVIAPRTRAQIP
jgi:hypothetical protein